MTLRDLRVGHKALITAVGGEGALRQHILDMGVIPGTWISLIKYAPMGDPIEVQLHGYLLTLRLSDAALIEIATDQVEPKSPQVIPTTQIDHPGLGEGGRYHAEACGTSEPVLNGPLTFALVGNQNCGKTTLFNQLTGSNQHVGNFPGVTVDRKSGQVRGRRDTEVVDLPGIYSLSPYTAEEVVSRRFILEERPSAIINIIDATNIERNLYLTMQLMELGVPMVLALNMMDELEGNGGTVLLNEMEQALGLPVVPIAAVHNQGVNELVKHVQHVARFQEAPARQDFCGPHEHGGAMHRCLHAVMHLIEDHAERAGIPLRFAASKLVEGDALVIEALQLSANELETVEHILQQLEQERGLDRVAALADMRYAFIRRLCAATVVRPRRSREQRRSEAFDRVLTGRYTALPAFVAIMALVFWLTFGSVGEWLQGLFSDGVEAVIGWLDGALTAMSVHPVVQSLIVEGICSGIGTVLSFLPLILLLFFWLSMLEDTGYMARIAFVMDKLLRRIGLSGRSIVPLLIGFGCSVPAVMATRTLPSERDRRLTVLLTPFMSCTAKLPVYAFFCAAFFPGQAGLVVTFLYILGILVGLVMALLLKSTLFRGEAVPFVMELPCYRLPSVRSVFHLMWDKTVDFLHRAFTVIFLASLVIWFLQHFSLRLMPVDDASESLLAQISGLLSPLFAPLGLGDWRWVTALISGFMAKETVVSTLGVLYPSAEQLHAAMQAPTALVMLVFCLLYTPCVAAISAIRRELGTQWAWGVCLAQCVVAWLVAYVVHLIVI